MDNARKQNARTRDKRGARQSDALRVNEKVFKITFYGVLIFIGMLLVLSIVYPTMSATVKGHVVVGGCWSDNMPQMCVDSRIDIFKVALDSNVSRSLSSLLGTKFGGSRQEEYLVCK